jgi:hypothetical protein
MQDIGGQLRLADERMDEQDQKEFNEENLKQVSERRKIFSFPILLDSSLSICLPTQ